MKQEITDKIIGLIILIIYFIARVIFFLSGAYLFKICWNETIHKIFDIKEINFPMSIEMLMLFCVVLWLYKMVANNKI